MFKGRHFEPRIILLCVRWYLSYGLSLGDLEEIIAERGVSVDHSTIHRWVVRYTPQLLATFNARKRPVMTKWHVDETYIKVKGAWTYLYRAIDKGGATVDFMFSTTRNLNDAKRFSDEPINATACRCRLPSTAARPIWRRPGYAMARPGCGNVPPPSR